MLQKLVRITYTLDPALGGPYGVVKNTSGHLSAQFEMTTVVFGSSDFQQIDFLVHPTANSNHYGFFIKPLPRHIKKVIRESDILLIHGYYLFSTLVSIHLFPRRHIFLMPHGTFELYQQSKSRIRKKAFDLILKFLLKGRKIHFIVATETEILGVRQKFPLAEVTNVGLGVLLPKKNDSVRQINSDRPRLLSYSRIAPKKRIDLIIESIHLLQKDGTDAQLKIFGQGNLALEESLKKLVNGLNLESKVDFEGFVHPDHRPDIFFSSDILVLPSENENFANSVAESISFEVPVIISREVALADFVNNFECGVVLAETNPKTIAQAVKHVMMNYNKFQENCRVAAKKLDWNSVVDKWIEVIKIGSMGR